MSVMAQVAVGLFSVLFARPSICWGLLPNAGEQRADFFGLFRYFPVIFFEQIGRQHSKVVAAAELMPFLLTA